MDLRQAYEKPELQFAVQALSTIHSLRKKLKRLEDPRPYERNLRALEQLFRDEWFQPGEGFELHDPTGEDYSETRADCDASIAGESIDDLKIVETMKPIVRLVDKRGDAPSSIILQKGVVVVRSNRELERDDG